MSPRYGFGGQTQTGLTKRVGRGEGELAGQETIGLRVFRAAKWACPVNIALPGTCATGLENVSAVKHFVWLFPKVKAKTLTTQVSCVGSAAVHRFPEYCS